MFLPDRQVFLPLLEHLLVLANPEKQEKKSTFEKASPSENMDLWMLK